jgi:hypothetical protein
MPVGSVECRDSPHKIGSVGTALCGISSVTLLFSPTPALTVVGFLLGVVGSALLESQLVATMKRQLSQSDAECVSPVSQAVLLAVRAAGSPIAATAFLSMGVKAVGFVSVCGLFYFHHATQQVL